LASLLLEGGEFGQGMMMVNQSWEEGRKLQICVAVSKVRISYSCKFYSSLIIFKINYRCFKAKIVLTLNTHITKGVCVCGVQVSLHEVLNSISLLQGDGRLLSTKRQLGEDQNCLINEWQGGLQKRSWRFG
jgi:hypothetical protein